MTAGGLSRAATVPLVRFEIHGEARDRAAAPSLAWNRDDALQDQLVRKAFRRDIARPTHYIPTSEGFGAAVQAGLTLRYSNGQTEGQVTRLKLIKRQGYGRANFDLLRKWVLSAA